MIGHGVLRLVAGMMLASMAWAGTGGMAAAQTTCATAGIATGGTITQFTEGNEVFCVHRFDSNGTFTLNQPRDVDHLIIGGGGGAGTGGGGAGGMLEGSGARAAGSYTVTVGAGGAQTSGGGQRGTSGGGSSAFGVNARGGGGGGRNNLFNSSNLNGLPGGSGGGAGRNSVATGTGFGGAGEPGQGFAGANTVFADDAGGGGGGAGGAATGINGGAGRESSITGTAVIYAGGGGSASRTTNGQNGSAQGSFGRGGRHASQPFGFEDGRPGVVIVRYVGNIAPTANAGMDVTVTEGGSITLNGLGSTDPENNVTAYSWARVDGSSGTLTNANTAQAGFLAGAPANGISEDLVFRLTVTDAFGLTSTDDITVTVQAAANPPPPAANGGNSVFDYYDPATQRTFRVHVFDQDGTFTLDRDRTVDYLILGGGGGGGAIAGGGGGAGGLRQDTVTQTAGDYPVVVGLGGAGDNRTNWPSSFSSGQSGGSSSAFGVTVAGGGGGGSFNTSGSNVGDGLTGGSGGGASHGGSVGQPTAGQGNAGGTGTGGFGDSSGGGGGGAGQAGGNGSTSLAGRGGDGVSSAITGSPVFYAGGGAGGGDIRGNGVAPNVGGVGGGGASTDGTVAGSAAPGTGGGGAGGRAADNGTQSIGGNGGSGVVILRYVVNAPPVADAGADANAFAGLEFTLNATGSTDPDGVSASGNITAYQWVQTGGTPQTLQGAATAQARFTPGQPASGTPETLTFQLTVTDAFGLSSTDVVEITLQGMADLAATKTARVFSETGTGCADPGATSPAVPANPAAIPGACIEYTISVENTGPVAATGIVLTDVLPGELTYAIADPAGWAASTLDVAGNTVTLSNGTINAGQTATLTIRATVK